MRRALFMRMPALLVALAGAGNAGAHATGEVAGLAWRFDPWVVLPLLASLALYAAGVGRLWSRAGAGRGIGLRECACFAGGWLVLALSLVSPLDGLGAKLFSAHMVQHELMMVVAAPLFVLSRPLEAWTWGLAPAWRRALSGIARSWTLAALFAAVTSITGAWLLHALALWAWHVPPLFEAALRDEGLHTLQHSTFLAAALAFWWSAWSARSRSTATSVASIFTTLLHTGALGALLTFAPHPWYGAYEGAFGLTALEDQQLGGLVMWVPGGLAYLMAGLALAASWLAPAEPAARA